MTTTYELYTNENGTPKAVEGKAPAILERVEALEGTLDNGVVTSINGQTGDVTVDVGVTSVNGNTGDITPEQTGCLPLSGGTMTGDIALADLKAIKNMVDTGWTRLYGGTTTAGSRIQLAGKDNPNYEGVIWLVARNLDDNLESILKLTPEGSLSWRNKEVVRSVNGTSADASGNVAISVPTGTVSQKASFSNFKVTKESNVTKTVSGLTANKPVYLVIKAIENTSAVRVTSGTALNDTVGAYSPYNFGQLDRSGDTVWLAVIPTGTSISLRIYAPSSAAKLSLIAYQ